MELKRCSLGLRWYGAHVLCIAVIIEVDTAWTVDQPAESASIWAGRLTLDPNDPVVSPIALLDLLAVSDRDRCRGEAGQEREREEDGGLELHFELV